MKKHTMSFGILLGATMACSLFGSTVVPLNIQELSARASRVAAGRIEHVVSYRDAITGRIVSKVRMSEVRALPGAGPAGALTFEMVGGTLDGVRQWIAGFPSFEVGDRVVLFLAEDTTTPLGPTVGLWQGVFFVNTDPESGSDILTNHARRPILDIRGSDIVLAEGGARPGASAKINLTTFLDRVRGFRELSPTSPAR